MKSIKGSIIGLAVLMMLAIALNASAQPGPKGNQSQKDKIEAQRIAFITDRLDLTPAEAQVFWPIYNEYDAKRKELRWTYHKAPEGMEKPIEEMTEKEALEVVDNQIIEAQKMLDLRKEYHGKFKAVLSAKKVMLLYESEREFQKQLIDKLRKGKGPGPGKGKGPGNGNGQGPGQGQGRGPNNNCIYQQGISE